MMIKCELNCGATCSKIWISFFRMASQLYNKFNICHRLKIQNLELKCGNHTHWITQTCTLSM